MKKLHVILIPTLIAILLVLAMASCNKNDPPSTSDSTDITTAAAIETTAPQSIKNVGLYETVTVKENRSLIGSSTDYKNPYGYSVTESVKKSIPDSKVAEFFGESYSGIYQDSFISSTDGRIIDVYLAADGVWFQLYRDNGELEYICLNPSRNNPLLYFTKEDVDDPVSYAKEEAKRIAKEFLLKEYSRSLELYRLVKVIDDTSHDGVTDITVRYAKYVGDYKTGDSITVVIDSKGSLVGLQAEGIGVFDDLSPEDIRKDRILESIDAFMESDYIKSVLAGYTLMGYSIKDNTDPLIVRKPCGDICISNALEIRRYEDMAYGYYVIINTRIK